MVFVSFQSFGQIAEWATISNEIDAKTQPTEMPLGTYFAHAQNPDPDTTKLKYPVNKNEPGDGKSHSLDLQDPPNIKKTTSYDTATGKMVTIRTLGDSLQLGGIEESSIDDYLNESNKAFQHNYFHSRAKAANNAAGVGGNSNLNIGEKAFEDIFGGDFVNISPQGSAELIFMGDYNRVDNPALPVRAQRNGQFKFDQKIRLNVSGKVGNAVDINLNYDTESNFEFDQMRKLNYQGKEDDIVKLVEVGDISLPIQGSLIQGSSKLFGLKTKMQFGKLSVTGVLSQQNTERKEITVEGGAQKKYFNLAADEYDQNRHFFLAHFFRDHYNQWAASSPLFVSPVQVTRVEVWVTNETRRPAESRNVVGFMDLAEFGTNNKGEKVKYNAGITENAGGKPGPDNSKNILYEELEKQQGLRELVQVRKGIQALSDKFTAQGGSFEEGQDYEFIDNARRLTESEYTLNEKLGYISLRTPLLNDEVLAVAVEYTYNGERHQIGEFSRDFPSDPQKPSVLFLKMLKGRAVRTDLPIWDLMMKNVYSLNYGRIEQEDFRLEVIYADDESGADMPYIPEPSEPNLNGKQLIRVLQLDKVNKQQVPTPDGVYDFVEGLTVNTNEGKIMFPVLEPFGDYLYDQFQNKELAEDYVYRALYDSIPASAIQQAYFNKFFLRGFFKGTAGDEISLNSFNVQPGSVRVTSGGVELQENQDYTVDYALGRVRIINPQVLSSGQQIKVSHESNTLFAIQRKGLFGTRLDYQFSEDFNVGGTFLYMRERPITQKVNVGDEPLKNAIWGLDANYKTESQYLTKLVDKLPLLETKEVSQLTFQGEVAQLIPGHPKVIGQTGTSYLDDFEGSEIPYDLRLRPQAWKMASPPRGQPNTFPNADFQLDDLRFGYNRALIAWYTIDPLFYIVNGNMPQHIREDLEQRSNHYTRQVMQLEVFPQKQLRNQDLPTQATFDLAYFPNERGPNNYNANGFDANGNLKNPKQNWAGIMRPLETNNFEAVNIQYMEFWMMDPFIYDENHEGGDFYINLGNVSEDVLKDGRKSFENGLPKDNPEETTDETEWARVPLIPNVNNAFDNDPDIRTAQDVGLDGVGNEEEKVKFQEFLDAVAAIHGIDSEVYQNLLKDPTGDDYHYFQGDDYDAEKRSIIGRYKRFNNTEGNSPVQESGSAISNAGSLSPDDEDINQDFTLSTTEDYFQYKIELKPSKMVIGQNYITDIQPATVELKNGQEEVVNWYQFKIPIYQYEKKIGNISDFKSIRFMRLLLTGFEDSVICRFAQLQLIRSDWRNYTLDLGAPGETVTTDPFSNTVFDATTVNIEENSERKPIPYDLPPDIFREQNINDPYGNTTQNEQSLSLNVCNLADGDARAVFKNTAFDVRQFKRIEMFAHAEGRDLQKGDITAFVRLGTDLTGHY
ncbi:MAG: cell surface protein SprA, partial [Bacteroidetes bacterium]|nr:cell surface protein SprA [Bacteroidota bacterium]